MKNSKKNKDNDLVTKKYIDQRLAKNTSEIIDYVDIRFNEVDKKFENIDKKFENIDKRFENIDNRFEKVDLKFDSIEKKLDNILKTLDWLVKSYQEIKDENTIGFEHYRSLDSRVTTLEKRVFAS